LAGGAKNCNLPLQPATIPKSGAEISPNCAAMASASFRGNRRERGRLLLDAAGRPGQIAAMFELKPLAGADKTETYATLESQLRALLHGERDFIANCANTAALLWHSLPDLNWAGFYRIEDGQLVLGPFQGKPACVRITVGKGVCGGAAASRQTALVANVRDFPGHIACDPDSRSEIVVPLVKAGVLLGVLDLDSPKLARFDAADQQGLENLVTVLLTSSELRAG
jgi:L-methionine (R)-S-oxide reductase